MIVASSSDIVVGIDPGARGALAVLNHGLPEAHLVMPQDLREIISWVESYTPAHVFIEKAQSFPGQGVSSAFNYGRHYGELLGILQALQIPFTAVGPRLWTSKMHMGISGTEAKKKSLEAFHRHFPMVDACPPRCKKPHDGIVDAYLIAAYGQRFLRGKGLE